jgi:Flp pilus assembly protein TadD
MATSDTKRHDHISMARPIKSKKQHDKRALGRKLEPAEVGWLETKIAEKFETKEGFYAAYKTTTGRSQDPTRQLQRILNSDCPITPPVRITFAKTLGMTIEGFDAGLKESLAAPSAHPDDDKKRAAERRWQYIQNHPIRGVEILFILKGAVGFDWFRELLDDTRLTFSRDEPSFKLGQALATSHEPNTKELSPKIEKPVCSYWEIYEPEKGYWFKKISPNPRTFSTVAGFDTAVPWSVLGVKRVEKLQDLALLTEIGLAIPPRAYQVGIEEFEVRFIGDTFSFSIKLSEHELGALHEFARQVKNDKLMNFGTGFSGVQLLDMFFRQLLPRAKNEKTKARGGIAGMSGPNGNAISFYPFMPMGFNKRPEANEYSFSLTMPAKTDVATRIKKLEKKLESKTSDAATYGELATLYSHEGRLQDAILCLQTAIKKSPPIMEIFALLGQTLAKVGRYDEALTHLRKAAALNPKHALVQTKLGICLTELGEDADALVHFQESVRLEPSNAGAQFNLGMALGRLGRNSEAGVAFQRVVDLEPENVQGLTLLGVVLTEEGRQTEAAHYFEKATKLDPNFRDAHEHLGTNFANANQHEKAVASFQRAIAIEENAPLHTRLSASLANLERWPEAEAACRRAVELDSNHPHLLVNLAVAVARLGKKQEAVELCQRAIKIESDVRAFAVLGESLSSLNRWDEAEAAYRDGLKLEPNHSTMLTNLGTTIATLGRLPEAAEVFERAIRADPSNATAQQNLAHVRQLMAKH